MIERIGNVFYRVRDMDAAVRFYAEVLGFALKFRDGDRWAAFDVNGMTFALEGSPPSTTFSGEATGGPVSGPGSPAGATVSLRVRDLDALVASLRARGADVSDVSSGEHERRADLRDPSGNHLVLYEPRGR